MQYVGYRIAGKPIYTEAKSYYYVLSFHVKDSLARRKSDNTDFPSIVRKIGNRYAVLQKLPKRYEDKIRR